MIEYLLSPDELEARMDARRAKRKQPVGAAAHLMTVAGVALLVYVVIVIVWGVTA